MRRRTRLCSEVVVRSQNGARILAPDDRRGVDVRNRKCDRLRGVEGCVALGQTADRTAAVLRVPIGPLVSRSRRRRGIAVADLDRAQRIGSGNGGGPAAGDRCENLHRESDQNDRKKFSQPLPHKPVHPTPLRNTRVSRSRVSAAIFIRLAYIFRTDVAAAPSFARSENATQTCNFRAMIGCASHCARRRPRSQ
jgi:hypothetical protein